MMRATQLVLLAFCLIVAACGDSEKNNGKNNVSPECEGNSDCPNGVCDLITGRCQITSDNNTNSLNSNNTTPNNMTTPQNNDVCGDGMVTGSETCDGDCPTECASTAPQCQIGTLVGLAENCTAECTYADISACLNGDGCCPADCTPDNDDDCMAECGNGVLDTGENCDYNIMGGPGTCPVGSADCDDGDACTLDAATGDAGLCTAMCNNEPITTCINGDGCCPGACDVTNDNDCSPKVGQGCADDAECPPNIPGAEGFCMLEEDYRWPGGYCAVQCLVDADCAPDAHCTTRVCVPDCTTNADCRAGYECYDYFATGRTTCAPAVGTAEISGGACLTDDDCLGALFGASCDDNPSFPGGYCLSGCQVNADCAAGTHCGTSDAGAQICVPDCATNADCRPGYECFDWLGDGVDTCGPVASGNGAVGDGCTVLQDCGGGQTGLCIDDEDWFGGACSLSCSGVNACPLGSHCSFEDPISGEGVCLPDCTSAGDCRTNYSCVDLDEDATTECAPSGNGTGDIGDACAGVYACAGGLDAFCIRESQGWRAGYCTETCTADADCPTGAHCAAQDTTTLEGVCVADCATDADCRTDGYRCFDWDDSTPASLECAPGGTGANPQGAVCEGVWECAGGAGAFCLLDSTGWPDGYCALDGCTSNADCSAGAHCGFFDTTVGQGICLGSCATDADCRAEYGCFDLDRDLVVECLPEGNGPVGAPCGGFMDCAGREFAICAGDPFPGGMCLLDCDAFTGTTCPGGSACVNLGIDVCAPSCTSSAQCRAGYTCQPVGGQMVCLP